MLAWIINCDKETKNFRQVVHLPDDFIFGVSNPYEHLVMGSNEYVCPYDQYEDKLVSPEPGKRGIRQYFHETDEELSDSLASLKDENKQLCDNLEWLKAQMQNCFDNLQPGADPDHYDTWEKRAIRLSEVCKQINHSWEDGK